MTKSDGSSLRIELLVINTELFDAVGGLTSKSFVDFPDINIANFLVGLLQKSRNGNCGSNTHEQRITSLDGVVDETGENGHSQLFGN